MGIFDKLFGRKDGANLAANVILLPIPRDAVEHPSNVARDDLDRDVWEFAALSVREGIMRNITLTISGYDDDPRELYEIPEVCTWARETFGRLPSLWFFLDDESKDRFIGWLCGPVSRIDIESSEFQERFDKTRMECAVSSTAASSEFLERAGASKELISTFYLQQLNKR